MAIADYRIGTRLGFLAAFLLAICLAVGLEGWDALTSSSAETEEALNRATEFQAAADLARTIQVEFKQQVQEWKDLLLRGQDPSAYEQYHRAFLQRSDATQRNLQTLSSQMLALQLDNRQIDLALKTHLELGIAYQTALTHYDPARIESVRVADGMVKGIDRAPTEQIDLIVDYVLQQSRQSLARSVSAAQERERKIRDLMFTALVLALVFGGGVTYWLGRSIVKPLQTAVDIAKSVAKGNLTLEIGDISRDETGQLLGALMEMSDALRTVRSAEQMRDWQKTGLNDLNVLMRGDQEPLILADNVLGYMAARIGAVVGVLFLQDEHQQHLSLAASYGLTLAIDGTTRLVDGAGLMGQAVKERKIVSVCDVPQGYLPVRSTLGGADPVCVLIVPLMHGEKLVGAVEFGAFKEFSANELAFLESAREGLAIGFEVSLSRLRNAALLSETAQQAEELRVQQEELQQSNEELEERADMLEQQREQIRVKNIEVENASREIWRKAEELQKVSAYKTEFMANMSHELRTPLNSMLILSGLLKENKDGNLTTKQVEYATTINGAGRDLLNLINDILDLSKVEAGKVDFQYEEAAIDDLCVSMSHLFKHAAEQKGLIFDTKIDIDIPKSISIDVQRTQQILKNLIGNAIKFTEHGCITLHVSLPGQQENRLSVPSIAFSVIDSGIGVATDKATMIFEAFKQADGSISRKYGGTGLGLSISLELARKMGGDLGLRSEEGQGSTFTLFLPLDRQAAFSASDFLQQQEQAPLAAAQAGANITRQKPHAADDKHRRVNDDHNALKPGGKSILIIEDDPSFARILTDFVRQHGFDAIVSADGANGIAMAQGFAPSAILLDAMLPKVDGWGVMRILKDDPRTRHIPVHFITCLEDRQRAMEMGAVGFVTKPVTAEQLNGVFSTIEEALRKSVKKLLIVEDNEIEAQSLVELLSERDVVITLSSSGGEAIAHLERDRYDCLVLDLGLSDMSGFELLAHLRDIEQARQLPVIIHSGRELTREQERELHMYAQSIVIKGAKSPERLLNEVTLFLHMMENRMDPARQKMLRASVDREAVFEGKKMLLVDDDMRNIFSLSSLLGEKGAIVIDADNGREALDKLAENPDVSVVLMDIMMPEMDGYEAMREIRKDARFRDLPIIAMTAKVMMGDQQKCLDAGASDYISKPLDMDKFMSLLRVWSGR